MNKHFIITVDTEGDGLWNWKNGQRIFTQNSKYIPKFQELCEHFNFKPVYLVNYEMAIDDYFISYIKPKALSNKCEIGIHVHAWNTPPEYYLENKYSGNPYITEYPYDIMEDKIKTTIDLLQSRFEVPIISHRSGRWATNDYLFDILDKYGIKVDCSVTPQLDLSKIPGCSKMCGNNYSKYSKKPYMITQNILEIPGLIL